MDRLPCADCDAPPDRRTFLKTVGLAAATGGLFAGRTTAAPTPASAAETAVKALYESLTPEQRHIVCFDWDHKDPNRGVLRQYVSNNWQITKPVVRGDFYTKPQQHLIHDIYRGLIHPDWHARMDKQAKDDGDGQPWGAHQSLAIFGQPGDGQFELVMTGRHQTLRADGNSTEGVAFGGPIFYGHAAESFYEKPDHPGNVFWPQAVAANKVYGLLDESQRKRAMAKRRPPESKKAVEFQGDKLAGGLAVKDLSGDQKDEVKKVLQALVEPFRAEDRAEAVACLDQQGGLDACRLTFYSDGDIGDDKVWDNWKLEGPRFVWYFRGEPHVHVWVSIA